MDIGGTAGSAITATTSNIAKIFSVARKKLREANVPENGDFFAVVSPAVASIIEQQAAGAGFSVADTTLRNGFAGTYLGFSIYVSNNLTTASNVEHNLIGKKGCIDLVIQQEPKMDIKDVSDKLGSNFLAWTVWGVKTFTKKAPYFLDVQIYSA